MILNAHMILCKGIHHWHNFLRGKIMLPSSYTYVMPTGMEETPKAALDIHCLQQGGRVALTQTIN